MNDFWQVQIHGGPNQQGFEISVVNVRKIDRAQKHYGWFDKNKLLITHNGGPCSWPLIPKVWYKMVRVANEVAAELNAELPRGETEGHVSGMTS